MASNTVEFRCLRAVGFGSPAVGESWGIVTDGETADTPGRPGIIEPEGVFAPLAGEAGDPGTDTTLYFWDDAHASIGTYSKLLTTTTGIRVTLSASFEDDPDDYTETLLKSFATTSGQLDGVEVTILSTLLWRLRARCTLTPSGPDASILIKFFHRAAGGTETPLFEDLAVLGTTFQNHDLDIAFDASFDTGEFLVAKVYAASGIPV